MGESKDVKRIDIKEFRDLGYLQELNRQFLHPLGLALEVVTEDDGSEHLGGVWDYRDDPEGIAFSLDQMTQEKFDYVKQEIEDKYDARVNLLGYWIQPVGRTD